MFFRRIFRWIVERLEAFFVLFLVLTVGIGLVWFLGAVVFPAQNRAMLRTPQIDQAAQMGFEGFSFWTPEKVLRGDQPQDLVLIYAPEGPGGPNSPFTLTLSTTSPYLFFIDPRNKQATTQFTLPLTATLPCTNTIGLVHTRTLPWWQAGSALVDVRLTAAPPPDGNPQEGAFPVELALEPGWQEALRGLSTQMAPTFLLALAGAVSSFFGLQLNQAEKRRKKAEKALGDFYQHLVKRDFPASQGAYQDMQKGKESLQAVDLERAQALFGLAEGDLGPENLTAIQALLEEKAAEAAGAMILAARRPGQHSNWNHELFGELLEKFPEDKIGDQLIKADFQGVKGDFDRAAPFQPMEWPPKPQAAITKVTLPGKPNLPHPFLTEYAEKDQGALFAETDSLFWEGHPLYQELEKAADEQLGPAPHFILGGPGSGKTAFALGLGEHIYDQDGHIFGLYFNGLPDSQQMAKQAAVRLFDFVLSHPTYLTQLGPAQMTLLAGLLDRNIGRLVVLSELERCSSPGMWTWLEEAGEEEKEIWEQIASGQLGLLRQAAADAEVTLEKKSWLAAVTSCARSLGFRRLRIAFDLPTGPDPAWLQGTLCLQAEEWNRAGWEVLVFAPAAEALPELPPSWERHALTWEDDQIESWAKWRWDTLNQTTRLEEHLGMEILGKLVRRACQNPRCFIRIWNQLITLKTAGFKPEDIEEAGRRVKCF